MISPQTEHFTPSVCGEILKAQEEIPAKGHAWGDWVETTAPPEDSKGEEKREWSACHETEIREVAELEHTHEYAAKVTAPTCTAKGYTTYTCVCGDSYKDNYTAKLKHTYTNYVPDGNAHCGGYRD